MNAKARRIGIIVMVFALVSLVMGAIFIQQGFAKESYLVNAMKEEKITITGIDGIVDSAAKAQIAADTVREHRHTISPTYGDLLAGKNFDPTNLQQLSYAQAMNIENYLYLAVASFGIFTVVKVVGVFFILMGLALAVIAYKFYKIA
jgi:hypothetical protein